MNEKNVGLYLRTSVTTDKYDRYEKELLLYCKINGWGNVKCYHDRAGGSISDDEYYQVAKSFSDILSGDNSSDVDAADIGQMLAEMTIRDEQHDRENLEDLLTDIEKGNINTVLVYNLSQLGKSKVEAFSILSNMMDKVEVYMPNVGRIYSDTQVPSGAKTDYF